MATWDDVRGHALASPETSEGTSYGNCAWKVRDKGFVWERPLPRRDLDELGARAPPALARAYADEHLPESAR